jgi:hypothetical protein
LPEGHLGRFCLRVFLIRRQNFSDVVSTGETINLPGFHPVVDFETETIWLYFHDTTYSLNTRTAFEHELDAGN